MTQPNNWSTPPPIEKTNVFLAIEKKLEHRHNFNSRLIHLELTVLEKMAEILNEVIEEKKKEE